MAEQDDQKPVENLLLLTSTVEPAYCSLTLFPKYDRATLIRRMGHPVHYSTIYSMSHMQKSNMFQGDGYSMLRQVERAPYMVLDFIESKLRTRWLGKAPETIDEEITQIHEMMEGVKSRSSNIRFPSKLPGEAT